MPKILHFADAHIDMANYGRHDPQTGLPLRVLDFLKSLDKIVDTAIEEKVDLVLFAGDAYKDRSPAPTFQREWGRRMMRLSHAGIPTLLLLGNHDLSPALGRANSIQEFETLEIPHIRVISKPERLGPDQLEGLPLQVLALPWINRSGMMASLDLSNTEPKKVNEQIVQLLTNLMDQLVKECDPNLPVVLTTHCSIEGASYGGERMVMLGEDFTLPGGLARDPRLDYVALGHIHKPQNLNEKGYPPVIYPGSIERVDFGEAREDRFFVIADVRRGATTFEWRKLDGVRPFIDCQVSLDSADGIPERLRSALPKPEKMEDAIVRLTIEYPRDWENLLDETALRQYAAGTFEFHLVKHPIAQARIRIPADQTISSLSPLDLLEKYWNTTNTDPEEVKALQELARQIIASAEEGGG